MRRETSAAAACCFALLSASFQDIFVSRIFDKDDDGLISVEELRHIMLSFGEKMSEKELDEMIAEANCNKDGHIDYEGIPLNSLKMSALDTF